MQTLTTMEKNNLVESMDFNGGHDLNFYDGCVNCKHHYTPFLLSGSSCAKEILRFVHIDLCGPIATSHGRAMYLLAFIDDFFRETFFYTMKIKFGVFNKLKVFKALIGKKIKAVRCDGGGEYNFKNFNTSCKENDIAKQTTTPYTPK
jgi:hypothetical protein